ncbi:DsbC family protein [Pararobbsia alpina]|uniref:Thiol:disulfide interchange protein n=1 Tax=Pararobbsia alpina TaxID=621374 RepID=A0A6S7BRT6_9BURK|nr:DsbC family protein [Pararobbsia alpina]CAB3797367.1 putative thiol:disulfide interchange protein DsbC [Pararobbsia alpina]
MKPKLLRVLPMLVLTMTALMPYSRANADAVTDKLKETLKARLGPEADVRDVLKTPIPGIYEVDTADQIIYSDANGDYVMTGDMMDLKNRVNLTDARASQLNKIDFSKLPLQDAVKVVKGNGLRKIAVFSDPNCPYCHKLEDELKAVDNVTVYTFLFPILSPDSTSKSKSIWCSADRGKAWTGWMLDKRVPSAPGTCDTRVLTQNLELGRTLRVTGTPTVFLADGRRLPGAVSAERLEKEMSSVQ